MANENTDHLTFPSTTLGGEIPADAPAAQEAAAYREVQLAYNPSDEDKTKAGVPVEPKPIDESQVKVPSASRIMVVDSVKDLPKGASGRRISEGVYEVNDVVDTSRAEKAKEVISSTAKAADNQVKFTPEKEVNRNLLSEDFPSHQ